MTFAEFQASTRAVPNLSEALDRPEEYDGPGLVYDGCYYILVVDDPRGKYELILANEDWLTDDLGELEARLYLWAKDDRVWEEGA